MNRSHGDSLSQVYRRLPLWFNHLVGRNQGRREPTRAPGQDTIAGPLSNTVKFGHSHTKSFKLKLFYFTVVNALTLKKLRTSSIIM